MNVGFIGIGKMGKPMATRLLQAGFTVHAHNRSRASVEALAALGAQPAASATEITERSEIVLTALPTPASVEAVYGEMAGSARAGQVFVDHSTVSPDLNRRCAALLADHAAAFLHAPVPGAPGAPYAG